MEIHLTRKTFNRWEENALERRLEAEGEKLKPEGLEKSDDRKREKKAWALSNKIV